MKIVVIGPTGSGKTHTINCLKGNPKPTTTKTIGCDHFSHTIKNSQGQSVRLTIWDCAGSKPFESLVSTYTRNADLIMLVYSPYEENSLSEVSTDFVRFRALAAYDSR